MRELRRICVYCGSSTLVQHPYIDIARRVGAALAERGISVVYGGGRVGLMGALADGALDAGGEVIGVIPEKLRKLEVAHDGVTRMIVTDTMHERKSRMAALADGFIALPGGWGTLEEIFEVTTWTQLEYHRKPVGLLNARGYYNQLIAFVQHAADEGFIRPIHRGLLQTAPDLEGLLEKLANCALPTLSQNVLLPS